MNPRALSVYLSVELGLGVSELQYQPDDCDNNNIVHDGRAGGGNGKYVPSQPGT